ncbi:lipopolysaccharide biosynthesis protein [Roseibium denhamense]|uniref:lipopolysaccharide biosynthesis protein n=1 Tax=Roseibium denhamense TaxID=76305 RepID=UPI0018AD2767|nr:polysaccharide biosynthesis C-terminal domain-containing protein [Roseibium denhamense]
MSIATTMIGLVSGFLVTALVARTLGPSGAGAVALGIWAAMSAVTITGLGRPQVVLKFAPDFVSDHRRSLASAAFFEAIPIACIAAVGAVGVHFLTINADWFPQASVVFAGSAFFIVYFLYVFSTAAAQGAGRFPQTTVTSAIGAIVQLPAAIAGAVFFGPAGAILGMALRYVPQSCLLPGYFEWPWKRKKIQLSPAMRSYGRQIWLTDMIDLLALSRLELVVLGVFWSAETTGYFAVAIALFGIIGQITLQLSSVFIVGFSSQQSDEGQAEVSESYTAAVKALAGLLVPIAFGGAALMPVFVPLVFGSDFEPAVPAAMILMITSSWAAIAVIPWSYLAAKSHSQLLLRTMCLVAVGSIGLLFALVPTFGLFGAAIGRALAELLFLVALVYCVRQAAGPAFPYRSVLKIAAAGISCGLAAFASLQLVPGAAVLPVAVVAGALVYILCIRFLKPASETDRLRLVNLLETRGPRRLRPFLKKVSNLILGPV